MKLWELHTTQVGGAIRTTPDGEAEIGGLVLSEKAYLFVVRTIRPAALVRMVDTAGPAGAADQLIEQSSRPESLQETGGRGLTITRSRMGGIGLVRDDESMAAEPLKPELSSSERLFYTKALSNSQGDG